MKRPENERRLGQWGNSVAITVPKSIVNVARLRKSDRMAFEYDAKNDLILLKPQRRIRRADLIAGMMPKEPPVQDAEPGDQSGGKP